jgi:hypothetical protein
VTIAAATVLQTNGVGTLSNGNLTYSSAVTNNLCRATRPMSGPTYWEVTPTNLGGAGAGPAFTGICGSAVNFTALQASSFAIHFDTNGAVSQNSNLIGTIASWAINQRQDWAYVPSSGDLWIRVNGGNWNNNALNDPATGVGALNIFASPSVFTAAGGLVPAFSATNSGCAVNFVFSSGSFVGTPPSGFSSIDAQQFTASNFEEQFAGWAEISPLVTKEFGPNARSPQLPDDRYTNYWQPASPQTAVSGFTKENGVIVPNKIVEMYSRTTGELLARTVSDGSGFFTLPGLGNAAVRIVGSDPTTYNSVVFDNVVPV